MNIAPISVVIPCYRCDATLSRAIESILHQTTLPAEVILVEDCSEDDGLTHQAISSLKEAYPEINILSVFLKNNIGPGGARNIGWDLATQPLIAFLDADDAWHPKKIEVQYGWMRDHPEVDLTGHLSTQWKNEIQIENHKPLNPRRINIRSLLFKNQLPTRSVMLKKNLSERFEDKKRHAEDYLLWLTLSFNGRSLWVLNETLAYSYKNDFGEGGLNGLIDDSHRGVLDMYQRLYRDQRISSIVYLYLISLAWLKHMRRKIIIILN